MRFVYKDQVSSYDELLNNDNNLDVYKRCILTLSIEVFKIRNNIAPNYLHLLTVNTSTYNLRDQSTFVLPQFDTRTYGYHSFQYIASKLWNFLDYNIKNTQSLTQFKTKIKAWLRTADVNFIKAEFF